MGFGGFSWRRALGISAAQARLSRKIGIPLSRSGRQQKIGRMVTGGGCLVIVSGIVSTALTLLCLLIAAYAKAR